MSRIPEQSTTVAEAETALAYLLLTEPGVDDADTAFLVDGQRYKLHIERVTNETEIAAVFRDYASIEGDKHDD